MNPQLSPPVVERLAAFGAYLRDRRAVYAPGGIPLLQGADMGRPSRLEVDLVTAGPRVRISGTATPIVETHDHTSESSEFLQRWPA